MNGGTIENVPDDWGFSDSYYVKAYDYGTAADSIAYEFRTVQKIESHYSWSFTDPTVTTNGLEITAIWETNQYPIHWLNDDGAEIIESQVEYGTVPVYSWSTPQKSPTTTIAYIFAGWSPEILTVTGEASYRAIYTESIRLYNINFDIDGSIRTVQAEFGAMPAVPENPTKYPSTEQQYDFSYWSPSIQNVSSDTTYTAVFSSSPRIYSVAWLNHDSSVIRIDPVVYGTMPMYDGSTPTKTSTIQYTYDFIGWDRELVAVTEDVSYIAEYGQSPRKYTVTWTDDLGNELDSYSMAYGQLPSYSYADPTKASTAEYRYSFSTWAPQISSVSGDITYRAVFTPSKMRYSVTWKDYDGSIIALDNGIEYGTMPVYSGAAPNRNSTSQYEYAFTGWSPEIEAVGGDAIYTAQYSQTLQTYTVTWRNDDGTVISSQNGIQYGTTPSFNGVPSKISTAQYEYTFARWSPAVVSVNGDATYTAVYDRAARCYTVTWKNYDGTVLESYDNVQYGSIPTFNGDTPAKPGTESERFAFSGWSPKIDAVVDDVEYTAAFTSSEAVYSITWRNSNGSVLKIDQGVRYGTMPEFGGSDPTLPFSPQYEYAFTGWSPSVVNVTEDAEYVAQYSSSLRTYTIKWYDDLGTLLKTDSDVTYGSRPVYSGGALSKDSTPEYEYTFSGWSPEVTAVSGDASYKAVFTQEIRKYNITWRDSEGAPIMVDMNVTYGSMPSFSGAVPTKLSTPEFKYTFAGWSPQIVPVSGDAEYRATFDSEKMKYSVTWKNHDGTVLDIDTSVEYGTVPVYVGTAPSRDNTAQYTYAFSGWSPSVTAVSGNVTYTATFGSTLNTYLITWKDLSGRILDVQDLAYGATPIFSGEAPTKDADEINTYEFAGWSPEIRNVSEAATYSPVFREIPNTYTVTWCDDQGNELKKVSGLVYGVMPAYSGSTPSKDPYASYQYQFNGWSPEVGAVTKDATYKAVFKSELRGYTVTWRNDDGTILALQEDVKHGYVPQYNGIEPSKPADAQYQYQFNGWSPVLGPITSDSEFTAEFKPVTRTYNVVWQNYDGSTLKQDLNVEYGSTPVYDGPAPTRAPAGYNAFRFIRWLGYSDNMTVTGDLTFTAVYEEYQEIFEIYFVHFNGEKTMINYHLSSPVIKAPDAYRGVPKGCVASWEPYLLDGRAENIVNLSVHSYLDFELTSMPRSLSSNNGILNDPATPSAVAVSGVNEYIDEWYQHTGATGYIEIPDVTVNGEPVIAIRSIDDESVTGIILGSNVQSVSDGAFSQCISLKNIEISEGNNFLLTSNGALLSDSGKRLLCVPNAAGETFVMPSSVREVASGAISGSVKTIVIDTHNPDIRFESRANSTGSDIALVTAKNGHAVGISATSLSSNNSSISLAVESTDYFGEKTSDAVQGIMMVLMVLVILEVISLVAVRTMDNKHTWLFLMPIAVSAVVMFAYTALETISADTSAFFTAALIAWGVSMVVEIGAAYYAFMSSRRSTGSVLMNRNGRILSLLGIAIGIAVALITSVLVFTNSVYTAESVRTMLVFLSVTVVLTYILGLLSTRKIFQDIRQGMREIA